jgi:hypothetical protein
MGGQMGTKHNAPPAHSLSGALRARALEYGYPLRAELEAIAAELDRHARVEDRARYLVILATEAPTVAEITAALDELQDWALGRAPLRDSGPPG